MKTISYNEAIDLLEKVGHISNISVPVEEKNEYGDVMSVKWVSILNNAVVYDLYGAQLGSGSNRYNAEKAITNIKKEFKIYSSYFNSDSGLYILE